MSNLSLFPLTEGLILVSVLWHISSLCISSIAPIIWIKRCVNDEINMMVQFYYLNAVSKWEETLKGSSCLFSYSDSTEALVTQNVESVPWFCSVPWNTCSVSFLLPLPHRGAAKENGRNVLLKAGLVWAHLFWDLYFFSIIRAKHSYEPRCIGYGRMFSKINNF